MSKYGMAIDLQKCVGCGACALACKTENNTEFEHDGTKYNWADFLTLTEGTFAEGNLKYKVLPVLCNHCTDAPCVEGCPVSPKALYKTEDGITMHNSDLCIGCRLCQNNCPYSSKDVNNDGVQYSVISYNPYESSPHSFYEDETTIIPGGTSSPAEIAQEVGVVPPDKNEYTHPEYKAVRPSDVTEKCIFCDHRLQNGELPYCVVSCPSEARIFGDLDDPGSEISLAIADGYVRLKNNRGDSLLPGEEGPKPNVFYINDSTVGMNEKPGISKLTKKMQIYPNPASNNAHAEFDLDEPGIVSFSLFNISGKEVLRIHDKMFHETGKQQISFDVSGLKSGTYVGKITTRDEAFTANIIVM
ncbi:MAG: 4Fe-4S dicluster domain-containing protein [Bacteroidota bacterium]|nr:4Fe-4S dicluster domain-containing protein [Bacteroidota bacterium]